jgi:hypothetical protein
MAAAALSLQRVLASGVCLRVEVSASAPDTSEELHVRESAQLAAGDEAKLDALRAVFPELEQQLAALVAARGEAARAALEARRLEIESALQQNSGRSLYQEYQRVPYSIFRICILTRCVESRPTDRRLPGVSPHIL